MRASISLFSMVEYNPNLFAQLHIPAGLSAETLTDMLMLRCADLEILYPNPQVLQGLIGVWSAGRLDVWEHLYKTTQYEYNPIENYDRLTDEWETGDSKTTETRDLTNGKTAWNNRKTKDVTNDDTNTIVDGSSHLENGGSDEVNHSKAGFNAVSLVPDERTITAPGTTSDSKVDSDNKIYRDVTVDGEDTYNGKETLTDKGTVKHEGDNKVHRAGRVHGNIGVTTAQQMITQEREIALFNLYDLIVEEFKCEFCVLVY